jgi:hypothetical protein
LARGSRVDRDVAAGDGSAAVHGEGQGPTAVVIDVGAEIAQGPDHGRHRAAPCTGVTVERRRAEGEGRERR